MLYRETPACSSLSPAPHKAALHVPLVLAQTISEHRNTLQQTPRYVSQCRSHTPENPGQHPHVHLGLNNGWLGWLTYGKCPTHSPHSLPTKVRVGVSLLEFPRTHGQGQHRFGHCQGTGENRKSSSGFDVRIPRANPLALINSSQLCNLSGVFQLFLPRNCTGPCV